MCCHRQVPGREFVPDFSTETMKPQNNSQWGCSEAEKLTIVTIINFLFNKNTNTRNPH